LTRGHLKNNSKKFKKNKIKNSKKPQSDTWHTPGLTRVHLKKIQKNHEMTRSSHCLWPLMI